MTGVRKPAEAREKELRLALARIQRGRASTKATKVSIAAVAFEAGVSTSLIHNHYPAVAEAIRAATGRSSRDQRDEKHESLKDERLKNKVLREEIVALRSQLAKIASLNEMLLQEVETLRAATQAGNVAFLPQKRTRPADQS